MAAAAACVASDDLSLIWIEIMDRKLCIATLLRKATTMKPTVKLKVADDVFNLESGGMWIHVILS